MGKFADVKKDLASKVEKKVFNVAAFNQLGTAMLNDPDYTVKAVSKKDDGISEKESTPVADLRKALIGGITKSAGLDSSEQQKMVDEYEFNQLPLYPVVSEMLEQYMDIGRPFTLQRKDDMKASIYIETQKETVKEVKSPRTGEVKKKKYSEYRKVKVKSNCPDNKKQDA